MLDGDKKKSWQLY